MSTRNPIPPDSQCCVCTMLGIDSIAATGRRRVYLHHDQTVDVMVCPTHEKAPYEDVRDAFAWAVRKSMEAGDE